MANSGETQVLVKDDAEDSGASESQDAWLSFVDQRQVLAGRVDAQGPKSQIQKAKAVLEREVQSARRAISQLQYQQNLLLPIARLPLELLLRVFMELCEEIDYDEFQPARTWLVVTHVCRTWRSAALDCASLWTDIPMHLGEKWANTYVARSKSATLSLPILNDSTVLLWQYTLVCSQISRIQTLAVGRYVPNLSKLSELIMTSTPKRLVKLQMVGRTSFTIPSQLLLQMPCLREIALDNALLSWDAIPWASLRSVTIRIGWSANTLTENLAVLAAALASAASLETLYLDVLKGNFTTPIATQPAVVDLPRLRFFTFRGYGVDFPSLSNAITMPSSTILTISIHPDIRGDADASLLSLLLRARSERNPQALQLSITGPIRPYTARMQAWQSRSLSGTQRGDPFIDMSLQSDTDIRADEELAALYSIWRLEKVQELDLSVDVIDFGDRSMRGLETLLTSAHRVEQVHFTGPRIIDQFFDTTDPRRGDASPMLPSLSHVRLTQLFDKIDENYVQSKPFRWVDARAAYAPIKVLSIQDSEVQYDTIRALESVAGLQVEWHERRDEFFGLGSDGGDEY